LSKLSPAHGARAQGTPGFRGVMPFLERLGEAYKASNRFIVSATSARAA
jgi:hypothetical protein